MDITTAGPHLRTSRDHPSRVIPTHRADCDGAPLLSRYAPGAEPGSHWLRRLVHGDNHHHYIHHAKFNWNFGSSPVWDLLCGTDYEACMRDKEARQKVRQRTENDGTENAGDGGGGGGDWREREATRQAMLVGGDTAGAADTQKRR